MRSPAAALTTLAAPPAGAAAAAPVAPPPINPQFGADVNSAQRNLDTTLQIDQAQRSQLGSTYGFGVDAAGNTIDDHTNPFSRAAALQTAYDNAVRGTTNSYAARGQLYSGAIQNAQNLNATNNLKGRDALIREFMAARTALDNTDLQAKNAYQSAIEAAQAAAVQYALDHQPDAVVPAVPPAMLPPPPAASANHPYNGYGAFQRPRR